MLASLAVADAQGLTASRCIGSRAATPPGAPPASRSRTQERMADEPLDVWLKPYERKGDPKDAMNDYL